MPSSKKVAWAQLRVGIVAAVAMVLLAAIIFLITGSSKLFVTRVPLYTYLSDSSALSSGANVRINGILAGRIDRVDLSGEANPLRVVKVTLEIDKSLLSQIPEDSMAQIAAENLLGSKYINIRKGSSAKPIKEGSEIRSKDVSDIEDVLQSSNVLLTGLRGTLERIDRIVAVVERGEGSIGKLIFDRQLYDNLNQTVRDANKIITQVNSGKGTLSRILYEDTLHEDVRGSIARMNGLLDDLQAGKGTAGKLLKDEALYAELRNTLSEFRKIAADLNAGKGTAGKLLKDDALAKQLQGTIGRVDTLLDKINSGQGTLGQLVVNPQMYESLNGASRELNEFLKAFRANPKKYLSIKLELF
jgi:phospholipid/cholesterol/gamma-HCH transport system substrate-binding protein